jgi:hypothetical protein
MNLMKFFLGLYKLGTTLIKRNKIFQIYKEIQMIGCKVI